MAHPGRYARLQTLVHVLIIQHHGHLFCAFKFAKRPASATRDIMDILDVKFPVRYRDETQITFFVLEKVVQSHVICKSSVCISSFNICEASTAFWASWYWCLTGQNFFITELTQLSLNHSVLPLWR